MKTEVLDLDKADRRRLMVLSNDIALAKAQETFPPAALQTLEAHLYNMTHRDVTPVTDFPWSKMSQPDRDRLLALLVFIAEAEVVEYELGRECNEDTPNDMAITRERLVTLHADKVALLAKYA
jgi:hypothetical protein